jgi:hypothetical protein
VLECFKSQHQPATDEGTWHLSLLDSVATRQPLCVGSELLSPTRRVTEPEGESYTNGRSGRDIIKQDPNAPIVFCGDFNNHMTYIVEQLGPLSFTAAVEPSTDTHRQGGHLYQVFARNMTFGEVNLSPGYSDEVSDHK